MKIITSKQNLDFIMIIFNFIKRKYPYSIYKKINKTKKKIILLSGNFYIKIMNQNKDKF